MKTPMPEVCGSCRYFDELPLGDLPPRSAGLCRRLAPRMHQAIPELDAKTEISAARPAVWPTVRGADWCGEWRRIEPAKAR